MPYVVFDPLGRFDETFTELANAVTGEPYRPARDGESIRSVSAVPSAGKSPVWDKGRAGKAKGRGRRHSRAKGA
jgi:hypothetical protein